MAVETASSSSGFAEEAAAEEDDKAAAETVPAVARGGRARLRIAVDIANGDVRRE